MTTIHQTGFAILIMAPPPRLFDWLLNSESQACSDWCDSLRGVEATDFHLIWDDDLPGSPDARLLVYGKDHLFGLKLEEKLGELIEQKA